MIVRINKKEIKVPQMWNDLSIIQIYMIIHLMFREDYKFFQEDEKLFYIKKELLKVLLDVDEQFFIDLEEDCPDNETFCEELLHLFQITDFLFLATKNGTTISLGLTQNKIPQIKGDKHKFFGPKDGLSNVTIYELAKIFTHHENYLHTKDEKEIDLMIAAMYRAPKPSTKNNKERFFDNDVRLPLQDHDLGIEARAKAFSNLPAMVKRTILFFVECCRKEITDAFPQVFKKDSEGMKMERDYRWAGLLFELSGDLTSLDRIKNMNYAEVLLYQNRENEKAIALRRRLENK